MKLFIALLLFIMSSKSFGFGAPDLLDAKERNAVYNFDSKYDKKKGFQKIVVWSAKTFSNSNESVKLKDPEIGLLVAKGNIACKALNLGNGYGQDQKLDFTLEITVEDKKTEVKISDVIGKSVGSYDDSSRPSKTEEMNKAKKECLDPFVDLIKAELQ